jgi:glucose-6-phosphate 1-dehydrogenase
MDLRKRMQCLFQQITSPPEEKKVEVAPTAEELGFKDEPFRKSQLSITVLGASGDLAKKETFPALLDLWAHGYLPKQVFIVGFARTKQSTDDFRAWLRPWLLKSSAGQMQACKDELESFLDKVEYFPGNYSSPEDFAALAATLAKGEARFYAGGDIPTEANRVFYFAIPPFAFLPAAKSIKSSALPNGFTRIIVEKPFGRDLASAQELASDLGSLFDEKQIFRMDHFLGYEICQNILFTRFGNAFLEPLMNKEHVASVRISLKEDFGTEGRGGYFTKYGIIRDVIQNHLLQMLTLVGMEEPSSISPTADVRDAKVKLLQEMRAIDADDVVLGQYIGANGRPGYLEDDSIAPEDREVAEYCSTFAQIVCFIDNDRWSGVPFIIRAGKGLDESKCEVRVQFKGVPSDRAIFKGQVCPRNEVVMRVSPKEAVYMKMNVKSPGLWSALSQSELDLSYGSRYEGVYSPQAYTRLILAGIRGVEESFVRNDELIRAWELFSPLLEKLEGGKVPPTKYPYGSRGPPEADEMLKKFDFIREEGYEWKQ